MRDPLERDEVATKHLAAPERAVRPHPRPVEDDRQRLPRLAVLREASRRVGVMVLHLHERESLLSGPLRCEVLGMKVAGNRGRLDTEHVEVEREIRAERKVGGLTVEIAEVRGEEGLRAAGDAERALQLGPRRDDRRRCRHRERQGRWRIAARAANPKCSTDDRVLAAAMDRPVVGEKGIGDLAQPEPGVLVVDRNRLVGAIAARQHEWPAHRVTHQVVERGVGEHQAEPR